MSDEQQPRPVDSDRGGAAGNEDAFPGASVPPAVMELIGDSSAELLELANRAGETFTVGVESVSGQAVTLGAVTPRVESFDALQQEVAGGAYMGFELHVALSAEEAELAAAFIRLDELGALLSIELGAEQMADEEFAAAQGETVAQAVRELLDLVSITLFTGELGGIEATLGGHYIAQPEMALALVADVSPEAVPLRLEVLLALPSGGTARVIVVTPSSLLERLGGRLAPEPADAGADAEPSGDGAADLLDGDGGLDELFDDGSEEPTPLRRTPGDGAGVGEDLGHEEDEAADGFGIASNPDNVSPFRSAGTYGAATGDDVDVHPVRFPPLPEQEPGAGQQAPAHFDLIMDVSMRVTVELGRSSMTVDEVLSLGPGSVVELNKLAGEPVDVLVNDRLIARGEVVVVDENFGVRVTEIVSPRRRVHAMGAS